MYERDVLQRCVERCIRGMYERDEFEKCVIGGCMGEMH